jgi:L-threonylcarbamoyladenylate synthase
MIDFENDINACMAALQQDGVILYPTDTIWGLGCNAFSEAAWGKIFTIKNRPTHKSMIILLADPQDIGNYVAHPPPNIADIIASFEVPTTLIYQGATGISRHLINAGGSIAIRITTDPFCKALMQQMHAPLVSTSANLSGQPSPAFFHQIDDRIKAAVDYVVQYRQDDVAPHTPSRIMAIDEAGNLNHIR